jgi:hypothetical protein
MQRYRDCQIDVLSFLLITDSERHKHLTAGDGNFVRDVFREDHNPEIFEKNPAISTIRLTAREEPIMLL